MRRSKYDKLCPILNAKVMAQSSEEVPVIVQFKDRSNNSTKESLLKSVDSIKANLPIIDAFSGYLPTDLIYRLSNDPNVDFISFDSKVYTLLDVASPSIEAYFPHDKGFEGEGITVAIIDTGVSPHYDLVKPKNRIVGFKDFINYKESPYDDNGHGTHIAGIIAGNGYSSRGRYVGVAPKSNILGVKALDKNGGGSTSKVIEAISYVIETKDKYNTKVINLSIGTPANSSCDIDPLCRAVTRAVEAGLTVVVAAGNSGPSRGSILSPGTNKNVITVGAVDDKRTIDPSDDTIADFSSRGPTPDGINKPDLVAPGVNINSLSSNKLDSYVPLSGTSMATPLVSGTVALLYNKYGDLKPQEVKSMLLRACINLMDSGDDDQGAGMLNLKMLFDNQESEEAKPIREVTRKRVKKSRQQKPQTLTNDDVAVASSSSDKEFFDTVIMILVILFLLDSRV